MLSQHRIARMKPLTNYNITNYLTNMKYCFVIYKFCKLTVSSFLDFVKTLMNSPFFVGEKFGRECVFYDICKNFIHKDFKTYCS